MLNKILSKFKNIFPEHITLNDLERGRPFTSENTWKILEDFYMSLDSPPKILEYGSGFSTYYHLKNLEKRGNGELTTIEHDPTWFNDLNTILKKRFKNIKFTFLLKPGSGGRTGCGTYQEFRDYVEASKEEYDVVIVDGRARKACVRHVLEKNLLKKGGMLVLFEAGRGNARWPKKNQIEGTYDYKPEVEELISRGGWVVEGTGYEKWSNWTPTRKTSPEYINGVPMEACFWINN